jgi:hypothetical protein
VPPHDGTAADVMAAHLYLPLPPLPADVPAELDVLVDRLTTKDPTRRISDARELADLAARLRDSMTGGMLIPPIPSGRGAAQSGPGAAVPGPVSQAAARAADAAPGWADGSGQASEDSTGNTALLAVANGYAGRGYVSDEWNVPPRMSRPTGPPGPGQPQGNPRRRAGTAVAVGVAAVASAGLVALLVSGAFTGTPAANQAPAGPSTASTPAASRVPSHSASGAARTSGPSAAATQAATSPQATPGGKKPSTSPSAHPRTSAPAGSTPSGSAPGTPTGGSPSGPATGSPTTGTPTSSPSPSPSKCFLGIICLGAARR